MFVRTLVAALAAPGILLALAGPAQAQTAGAWLIRAGASTIGPQVSSADLAPAPVAGVQVDVGAATSLAGGVSYMLTDHWAVDLPLALPFEHRIIAAGAIDGLGEIASTKVLPATVFAQYRFGNPQAEWRPYLGVGLTYAVFFDEAGSPTLTALSAPGGSPTTVTVSDRFGLSAQAGLVWRLSPHVFVEGMVGYTRLKVRATLSTGQGVDVRLDPLVAGLFVGWRF